ncbi:MAG: (Fe-S)-binding protein [Thermoleophilia bacterium]
MKLSRKKLSGGAFLERFREQIRHCTRCAGCLPACPTFGATGEETLSPRGRMMLIGAALDGELPLTRSFARRLSQCLLCGACTAACPSGVNVSEAILAMREELARSGSSRLARAGSRRLFGVRPDARRRLLDFGGSVYGKAPNRDFVPWRYQGRKRAIPHPGRNPLEEVIAETTPAEGGPSESSARRVALFPGCATSLFYQQTAAAAVRVLARAGMDVVFPRGLGCCGQPLRSIGETAAAESLARKNLDILGRCHAGTVVTVCSSCALTLARAASRQEAEFQVSDIHALLAGMRTGGAPPAEPATTSDMKLAGPGTADPLPPARTRVAWHDPCHLGRGLGLIREPREIIAGLPGVEYVEAGELRCCGGGLLCLQHYGLALKIGIPRAEELAATGAMIVATGCPGCRMQLEDMLGRLDSDIRVMHTVELLDGGWAGKPIGNQKD